MSVLQDGIGESSNTPVKNDTVSALFGAWCNQVAALCNKMPRRVRLVDLTAGRGCQIDGSPTFLARARSIATRHDLDIAMMACEESEANAQCLRSQVSIEHVLTAKWQDVTEPITQFVRGAFAFIYHDPNTCHKEHPDIIKLANDCNRADFCLHFDANQIKRIRCAGIDVTTMSDLVLVREHCVIRRPFGNGSQWTVMYLSQCSMRDYSKYGFYKLGASETGDALLRRMQYTAAERKQMNGQKELNFGY